MRHRADDRAPPAASPPSAAAAAAAAARAASRRPPKQNKQLRGFLIGTGAFLVCLFIYVCFGPSRSSTSSASSRGRGAAAGQRVAERDIAALGMITQQVSELATLPTMNDLSQTAARIGSVYLQLLEQVVAAEEKEDGGHALRQLDVSQHYLTSIATAVHRAADVSYTKLKRMLLKEPNAELALAPNALMRTMYGWMLSDLYLYSAVLPEYYLLQDNTASHAAVLLRSVHLLSWTSLVRTRPSRSNANADSQPSTPSHENVVLASYDIFNWSSGAACRKGPLGAVSPKWMQFCESSFASWPDVARRTAATYEELIVLYPAYAPLRLHYAVAFAFLAVDTDAADGTKQQKDGAGTPPAALTDHTMRALTVIRNDRAKLNKQYQSADAVHAPLLALLEAFLSPIDMWSTEQEQQLVDALGSFATCERARTALLEASQWPGDVFAGEYRPPLLRSSQLSTLLTKARVLLGVDHEALVQLRDCI